MAAAKSKATAKPKGKPRGKPWKKGQSGNPAGAPKRGESWAEIIKRVGDMTPAEAAQFARGIAGKLASLGDGITLKEAVVLRVFASLMFEPTAAMLAVLMERAEGKVQDKVDLTSDGEALKVVIEHVRATDTDTGTAPGASADQA